jgi:hypothetical protein
MSWTGPVFSFSFLECKASVEEWGKIKMFDYYYYYYDDDYYLLIVLVVCVCANDKQNVG